jgi:hypothetical protein
LGGLQGLGEDFLGPLRNAFKGVHPAPTMALPLPESKAEAQADLVESTRPAGIRSAKTGASGAGAELGEKQARRVHEEKAAVGEDGETLG